MEKSMGKRMTAGKQSRAAGVAKSTNKIKSEAAPGVSHEQIAMRAYEIYLSRGNGMALDDWLQAERELAEHGHSTADHARENPMSAEGERNLQA